MTVLELDDEKIFKLAGDPAVYAAAPFLEPMKNAALSAAAKYRSCKKCQKPAYIKTAKAVGGAFVRLTLDADPSLYPPLKAIIFKILNVHHADQVMMNYTKDGQQHQLTF